MRPSVILLFATACIGGTMRPAVTPMLSELPADPEKRNAVLERSGATPGPEQRRGQTKKQKKIETAAAGAAAAIGLLFSSSGNVTLGGAGNFDENLLFEDKPQPKRAAERTEQAPVPIAPVELVPWVRLNDAADE